MNINRYGLYAGEISLGSVQVSISRQDDGDFVRHSDMLLEVRIETQALQEEHDALAAENLRLREALSTAKYRIEQGRVWNGMGWTLTGLHPLGQQKVLDAIEEALSSGKGVGV